LGLAFPRQFNESGFFYVYYTTDNPLRSVVSRFSVSQTNANQADVNSEEVLLQVGQPFSTTMEDKYRLDLTGTSI